ncbi:ParB/RepB/Spo0J family partition protein [Rhodoligotrophos defluvii]|uniref:ParB/RepB/Spo0J family partition protein n=1 Tax=Rhodoligotrophos defluvii TaxID=2561934 RepID=UPI0010C943B9|nr:ParB/RepB/Spo0J family partition protein [Rhodoligotrophos defluvii]
MVQAQKKRLGRGLAALIGDGGSEEGFIQGARSFRQLPIEHLVPSPRNPRKTFRDDDTDELVESVRSRGVLQPLLVRPLDEGRYEIVAGERRWRAAQKAGIYEVPVLIRELTDAEALEVALVENIQREDLNPVEEAEGYRQLMELYGYTQQQLADAVGKSRSHIANTLRLLTLPRPVIELLEGGSLSAGHARALIATDRPEELAERIIAQGLSVRDTESLARAVQEDRPRTVKPRRAVAKDTDTVALEKRLYEALGLAVTITHRGEQGGDVRIRYKTLDQLDLICRRLAGS